MNGFKRSFKKSWLKGREPASMRAEMKFSIKINKKYLKRKARHEKDLPNENVYRKLTKDRQYDCVT